MICNDSTKIVIFLTFVWEGAGKLRTHVHINNSEINIQKMEMNQTKLNRGQT